MGWLTHVYEVEATMKGRREEVADAIREIIKSTKHYALMDNADSLFKRPGDKHEIKHAYLNSVVDPNALLVVGTCTSPLMKFVDDIAFTVISSGDGVTVKGLSVSRIGEGDMFKNK